MELNCQSLSNKIDRVMELLVENQTDVLFLNETWLNDVKNDVTVAINTYNYKIYHSNMFGRGKGVAFLVRNNFNINKRLTNYNLNTFDAIRLSVPVSTVSHQHQQLSIVCLYRYNGIGSQFDSFLNEFSNFISELTLTGYSFVIARDFNIHMNKDNESETKKFNDLLCELDVSSHIPQNSTGTHNDGNTIDFILSDSSFSQYVTIQSCEQVVGAGDHFPINFKINIGLEKCSGKKEPISFRNIKDINKISFQEDLTAALSETGGNPDIMLETSFETALQMFNQCSKEVLDLHAPIQTKMIKTDTGHPPWVDGEYRMQRAKRRQLERLYKRTKNRDHKNNFNKQARLCRKLIVQKRENYLGNEIQGMQGDQKSLFSFIHRITDSSKRVTTLPNRSSDKELANDFNKFFSEKIKLIRESIPTVNEDLHNSMDFNEHLVNPSVSNSSCLSEFAPCTDEEVLTVLQNSGIKMSPMDIHSAKFMSENKEFYVPYLKHLINLSLKTGSIAGLKEAIVRPLLKEHDANSEDFSKYRPISNLSFFSKLIERIVLSRLQKHA